MYHSLFFFPLLITSLLGIEGGDTKKSVSFESDKEIIGNIFLYGKIGIIQEN